MAEIEEKTSETPAPEAPKVEEKPKEKTPTPAEVFTPEKVKEEAPKAEPAAPVIRAPDHTADLDALKAQVAELTAANEAASKEKAEMERALMQGAAADRYGLSAEAREFLTGSSEEELEEAAKKLAALTAPTPITGKGGLDPNAERSLADLSPAELAARIPKNFY
ncbi:hypothetical protein ACFYYS_06160 [Streptomyces sp. NPDC002120]|uniref:hypothetical protein n=1 Tax=Streptomyces sp. NPDC002120 TaxID=3364631 RepID=UPI0036B3F824